MCMPGHSVNNKNHFCTWVCAGACLKDSPYHTPSATKQLETTRLPVDSPSSPAKSRLPQPDSQGCQAPAHWQLLQNCHALEIPLQQDCYTNFASCRFAIWTRQNEEQEYEFRRVLVRGYPYLLCNWSHGLPVASSHFWPMISLDHEFASATQAAHSSTVGRLQRSSHCWAPVQHRIETWVWCPQAWPNQWHTRSQGVQHHQLLGPEISLLPSHSNRLAKTFQVARPTRKVIATTWNQKTSTAKILMNNNCASDIEKPKLGTYKAESSFH